MVESNAIKNIYPYDGWKKAEQLKILYDRIYNFNGFSIANCFNVFTNEASSGKTDNIITAVSDLYIKENRDRKSCTKSLIVTLFRDRIDEDNFYKPLSERINDRVGEDIAISIDSYNKKQNIDKINKYPVLIITHSQYVQLCKKKNDRDKFIHGRKTLIIDEELLLLETKSIRNYDLVELENFLNDDKIQNETIMKYFHDIIIGLLNSINNKSDANMKFINISYDNENGHLNKYIKYIIDYIKQNITDEFLENYIKRQKRRPGIFITGIKYKNKNDENKQIIKGIISKISSIKYFYNNPKVIICNGTLYYYNEKINYFFLENNILLDASAKFNYYYKLSNNFNVIDSDRIISYKNDTLNVCYLNTTEYSKKHSKKLKYYYEALVDYIKNNCKKDDKILIVGLQEELKELFEKDKYLKNLIHNYKALTLVNFQALRGKNIYSDYNKCFIIHTPNMNYEAIVYLYMFYNNKNDIPLTNEDLKLIKNQNKNLIFRNKELEKVRKTFITSNIYQAVTRINRNHDLRANIYLFILDDEIVQLVKNQLKNIRTKTIDLNLPVEPKAPYGSKSKEKKRFKNSAAYKFIEKLKSAKTNITFPKETIRILIEFNSEKKFKKNVIDNAIEYIKNNPSEGKVIIENNTETLIDMYDRIISIQRYKIIITVK